MRASMRLRSSSLKVLAAGQLEVVVEPVLDGRTDGVAGPGPQVGHRLGQDVGGGVAQDVAAGVGAGGDDGHLRPPSGNSPRQVAGLAIHVDGQGGPGQPRSDGGRQVGAGGSGRQLPGGVVGEVDGDLSGRIPLPAKTTGGRPGPEGFRVRAGRRAGGDAGWAGGLAVALGRTWSGPAGLVAGRAGRPGSEPVWPARSGRAEWLAGDRQRRCAGPVRL